VTFSIGILLTTFLVILSVELPDKTLVATLVLSTKYRPLPVLAGVSAAFFVQCLFAVTAGQLLHLLPHRLLLTVVALLFAAGAVVLLREARRSSDSEPDPQVGIAGETDTNPDTDVSATRMAATSFGVLFAAEWGDASQLATAALTARYDAPVTVFIGAFAALLGVAALAIALGQVILRVVPLVWIHRVAGVLFAVLALLVAAQVIRG